MVVGPDPGKRGRVCIGADEAKIRMALGDEFITTAEPTRPACGDPKVLIALRASQGQITKRMSPKRHASVISERKPIPEEDAMPESAAQRTSRYDPDLAAMRVIMQSLFKLLVRNGALKPGELLQLKEFALQVAADPRCYGTDPADKPEEFNIAIRDFFEGIEEIES